MIDIGSINHTFPSIGYAMSVAADGRTSLPVSPSQLIYSHFKHVSGTPAPEGTSGVNITKLKILDSMIESLSKMKGQPIADFETADKYDENRINALIDQYQKQMKAAQSVSIYTPPAPITGALFSITI